MSRRSLFDSCNNNNNCVIRSRSGKPIRRPSFAVKAFCIPTAFSTSFGRKLSLTSLIAETETHHLQACTQPLPKVGTDKMTGTMISITYPRPSRANVMFMSWTTTMMMMMMMMVMFSSSSLSLFSSAFMVPESLTIRSSVVVGFNQNSHRVQQRAGVITSTSTTTSSSSCNRNRSPSPNKGMLNHPFALYSKSRGGGSSSNRSSNNSPNDFRDIDIDDVLRQAEAALEAVQYSIPSTTTSSSSATTTKEGLTTGSQHAADMSAQRKTITNSNSERKQLSQPTTAISAATTTAAATTERAIDILASTMGGVLWGTLLGTILVFQFPDLTLDWYSPIIVGIVLGSVGMVGSVLFLTADDNNDNNNNVIWVGRAVVRAVFRDPTLALVNAIADAFLYLLESIQQAFRRKVEATTNEIAAIPGKIADSAQRKVVETKNEIIGIPGRIVTSAQKRASETSDEIKAIPQKIVTSAQRKALEVVEEVSAIPQKATERVLAESDRLIAVGVVTSVIAVAIVLAGGAMNGSFDWI